MQLKKVLTVAVMAVMTLGACQKPDLDKIEQKLEQKKVKENNSTANQVLPTEALKAIDQTLSGANKVMEVKDIKFSTVPYVYELPSEMKKVCGFNEFSMNNDVGNVNNFCTKINIELAKIEPVWIEQIVNKKITNDDNPKLIKFKQTLDEFVGEHLALVNDIKENAPKNQGKQENDELSYPTYAWSEKIELLPSVNNVAQIVVHSDAYMGGAHSLPTISYLVFDMDLQSQIEFDDVIKPEKHELLHGLYYQAFKDYLAKELNIKKEKDIKEYEETWKFQLSDNFYFHKDGLAIVYQPYEMGSFAQGFIELIVPYEKLSESMRVQYLPIKSE